MFFTYEKYMFFLIVRTKLKKNLLIKKNSSMIVVYLFPCSQVMGKYGHSENGRNWMSFPPQPYVWRERNS
jgi:hypothetical protein